MTNKFELVERQIEEAKKAVGKKTHAGGEVPDIVVGGGGFDHLITKKGVKMIPKVGKKKS